jgi:hypothetical protein
MADLKCKEFIGAIKGDFGALWHCEQRGETLEITTPYLYPDHSFVTIYLTKRGKRYIVSDGADASEFLQAPKDDEPFMSSLVSRATQAYSVEKCEQAKKTYFFKATEEKRLISSAVFDVASFLVSASNAASLSVAEEDTQDRNSFRVRADSFIKHSIPRKSGKTVKFNQKIPEVKEATFSAIVTSASKISIVIYLTGSNLTYFQHNLANAIVNVEFLKRSNLKDNLGAVLPFLNDDAVGYQPNRLTERLGRLKELTHNNAIPWREKEKLIPKLAA